MVEVSTAKRNITPLFPMYMRGYAMYIGNGGVILRFAALTSTI